MLDLDFGEEQEMLREAVRGLVNDVAPLEVVREMEDDAVGYPESLWKQLGDLDLIGITLPEEYGGSGMSTLEACVIYEEFGRALTPVPHFVSAIMAGGVLAAAGSDTLKAQWLPRIATGETIFSIAAIEPGQGFSPRGISLSAQTEGGDVVLAGTKWHVAFAEAADHLVVLARTGDGETDIDLFIVPTDADGLTLRQMTSISSDTQFEVVFDGVRVPESNRIGDAGTGWATWNEAMLDGAILQGALAIGGAQHALDITVQYSKDREQFDKPLGAFQALAHDMAEAKTTIDGGMTLLHQAAWSRAEGRDVTRLAPMAKLFCSQTYRDVTATAQQIFGGVGFTVEYEIQLYFRRAKQLQIMWWDKRHCEELIATSVLDSPELTL